MDFNHNSLFCFFVIGETPFGGAMLTTHHCFHTKYAVVFAEESLVYLRSIAISSQK